MDQVNSKQKEQKPIAEQQAPQENNKKENQEYFTISWGLVDPTPIQHLSNDKNYHLFNNQAKSRNFLISSLPQKDNQSQIIYQNQKIERKQQMASVPSLDSSKYYPSLSMSNQPFNQTLFSPKNTQIRKINQSALHLRDNGFENRNFLNRLDLIPKQQGYYQSQRLSSGFPQLKNHRVAINHQQSPLPGMQHQQEQNSNQKLSQESIKLNIRSQLIRRSRKNQITTNNAHKKYINCLRNLFYQALSQEQIHDFQRKYNSKKSSRAFFFIILVYIKYRFSESLARAVKEGFEDQMKQRIMEYQDQVYRSCDPSIKNFRLQEIQQIEIALRSIQEFYDGNTVQAIQHLYRKGKQIIMKVKHFQTSRKTIQKLQAEYSVIEEPKISKPYIKNTYQKKIRHPPLGFDQEYYLNYPNEKEDIQSHQMHFEKQVQASSASKKDQNVDIGINKNAKKGLSPHKDLLKGFESQNFQPRRNDLAEQLGFVNDQISSSDGSEFSSDHLQPSRNPYQSFLPLKENIYNRQNEVQKGEHQRLQDILFPPIPPHFYLPQFDQKYGHLFRKFVYVKSWNQLDRERQSNSYFHQRNGYKPGISRMAPSPLVFSSDFHVSGRRY